MLNGEEEVTGPSPCSLLKIHQMLQMVTSGLVEEHYAAYVYIFLIRVRGVPVPVEMGGRVALESLGRNRK